MNLEHFLAQKPLYYQEIDYTRMPKAYESVRKYFDLPKIIHIIGTNGKGSTGRFLAHYLFKSGFKTGHYTSPHILDFKERIWIDGKDVDATFLESCHEKLLTFLSEGFQKSLSYFEYTTLLAMVCFEGCDYIVLEAGLGGEHDATSVFESDLTLITPIAYDHEAFLGNTIEEIATTKINAVRKFAVIGKQSEKKVYKVSRLVARKKHLEIFRFDWFFTHEEKVEAKTTVKKLGMADFFATNLLLAMAGAKFFGFAIDFSLLEDVKIFGRCQKIAPNITIDVGHNPAAAEALLSHFKKQKIILVYNSYADKDYFKILLILKPIIQRVEILPINHHARIVPKEALVETLESLQIEHRDFTKTSHKGHYLVFGSFSVVEEFLKHSHQGVPL